jgi:hypothetical protein
MRKLSILLLFTLTMAFLGLAQTAPSQNYPQVPVTQPGEQQNVTASGSKMVAQGTELMAALDQPLSTKNSKVGDTFTATVQKDVPSATDGSVAIPAGSKIQGQVVEAEQGKALPTVRGKGRLNMRFNSLTLPNGSSVPLSATLVSVHGTTKGASAGEEGEVSGGTSGKEAAKKVGIGAAIGTVGGLIFGHALRGLLIGAIAGGGYVLATEGRDVNLPAETGLKLRVEQNISVPATPAGR